MNDNIKSIVTVKNTRTGAVSVLVGIWFNEFAGKFIVNVRQNGYAASWFAADCAVL